MTEEMFKKLIIKIRKYHLIIIIVYYNNNKFIFIIMTEA
jgi:hypothetical protein